MPTIPEGGYNRASLLYAKKRSAFFIRNLRFFMKKKAQRWTKTREKNRGIGKIEHF